ncbi:charged multivesicular body protein 6-A-like [Lineus longissimus]|uniref:charged multivesicular body protein 6-A-like n=1 Tax=Lineus longissimus TaxID=88925 RepID=UPI002B4FAAD6
MGALFGKPKKKEGGITDQDRAVLQLKQQRDKLKQYQKKITVQLEKDRCTAKQLLHDGKKDKAKALLRKKKYQESLLTKTDAQLENIGNLVQEIEFAQVELQVVEGLKSGNEALKKMHQLMSLEDVEKIMDDTQEAVEYQREIDDLLSGGLTQEDEDDVLAELDDLVKQSLPDVPTGELDVDEELELPDVPGERPREKTRKKEALAAS